MHLRRTIADSYAALRRRLIRETEAALLYGMLFPKEHPRIPTVEVGTDTFDSDYALAYWRDLLGEDALAAIRELHPEPWEE